MSTPGREKAVQLDGDEIRLYLPGNRPVSKAVSKLCVALASSHCDQMPCMVFVKPYSTQVRWNSSNCLGEYLPDYDVLPAWTQEIFVPVLKDPNAPIQFGCHLFGIDQLVNSRLAGFNFCLDLLDLIDEGMLSICTVDSQLMLSLNHNIKTLTKGLLQISEQLTVLSEFWQLCFSCTPDPYAEPLWMFYYGVLRPILTNDIIPIFLNVNHEFYESLMSVCNRDEVTIARWLSAHYAASVADIASLCNFVASPFSANSEHLRGEAMQRNSTFLNALLKLVTSLHACFKQSHPDHESTASSNTTSKFMQALLTADAPYGHLAVMNLYRDLVIGTNHELNVLVRDAFETLSMSLLRHEQAMSDLDWYLLAAVNGFKLSGAEERFRAVFQPDSPTHTDFMFRQIGATAGVALFRSHCKDYLVAIPMLESACTFFKLHDRHHMHLHVVLLSELMQILNATGQETRAIACVPLTMSHIVQDPLLHHTMHFWPDPEQDRTNSNDTRTMIVQEGVGISAQYTNCQNCRRIPDEDRKNASRHLQTKSQKATKYSVNPFNLWLNRGKRVHERTESHQPWRSGNSIQDKRSYQWLHLNFDALTNLKIIQADSYIGQGNYKSAAVLLDAIVWDPEYGSEHQAIAALRLSKVLRRQNVYVDDSARFTDLIEVISYSLASSSSDSHLSNFKFWEFCVDEVEAAMCTLPDPFKGSKRARSIGTELSSIFRQQFLKDPSSIKISGWARTIERGLTDISVDTDKGDGHLSDHLVIQKDSEQQHQIPSIAGTEFDAKSTRGFSLLYTTVEAGYHIIVELLLAQNANPQARTPYHKQTVLHLAADHGDLLIVELLLQYGADIDAVDDQQQTALHGAAERGHLPIVELLVSKGANIQAITSLKQTALHLAAEWSHLPIVELLVSKGADIKVTTFFEQTVLHLTAGRGHLLLVELLISKGANIEAITSFKQTALHLAAERGHLPIVELLVSKGANIEATTEFEETTLHLAVEFGHLSVVELLVAKGANIEALLNSAETPLHLAAKNGHPPVVELLVSHGANIEATTNSKQTALHRAAESGHLSVVELLVSKGADIEATTYLGEKALHIAAKCGHLSVVELLVSEGANIEAIRSEEAALRPTAGHNSFSVNSLPVSYRADFKVTTFVTRTALQLAAEAGHLPVVELLISKGANIEAGVGSQETTLHLAVKGGHIHVVEFLVSKGANIQAITSFKQTALHIAAEQGHLPIVELLVSKGADIKVTTFPQQTVLHLAAKGGHLHVVEFLVSKGADLKTRDSNFETPLLLAAEHGHLPIVELLVSKGADIKATTLSEQTVLHLAAKGGHLHVVEFLVSKGVDLKSRDLNFETPLLLAAEQGHQLVVQLLISKGAVRRLNYRRR